MRGSKIQFISRYNDRNLLVIGSLFPDFFEALFDAIERRGRRDGVDKEESVCGGDAQPPHRRELHVSCRVQDVHL